MKDVNETILQASYDTGACYGVAKYAEIIFKRGDMVKGLQMLRERMKTMNKDQKQIYKFLLGEQADAIKIKEVCNRVKEEINRRRQVLTETELHINN